MNNGNTTRNSKTARYKLTTSRMETIYFMYWATTDISCNAIIGMQQILLSYVLDVASLTGEFVSNVNCKCHNLAHFFT